MLHTGGIEKRKDANIFNMLKENLKNLMNKIYLFAKLSFKTGGGKDFFFFSFLLGQLPKSHATIRGSVS
jgi:hypothetical protein